ncbi:hypothetical protein [Brevundimonas mediterranea]|uniref:Uncharacterized protein n=1 Tax=Brevundimonas mediterranea TaxID=74329 RepID=A0A7Z9C6W2_9CAUL|nr:hypothetical protein [Brevundimonas mediterranea]VDC51406.1 hypothetical protein BREV_BREV_00475 [Brevundimonas mediterranea]
MSDLENSHLRSLKAAQDQTQLYIDYWKGSLGRYLTGAPSGRTHEEFAQWLSDCTAGLTVEMDTARAIKAAVEKWHADATVARTIGVPEPSVLPYLPIRIPAPKTPGNA